MAQKPTPYWDYIRVDTLLSLQTGIGASEAELTNDEVMFITVHQIDELWFKLILREMVAVRTLFARAPVPEQALASAVRGIRRMETILHQLAAHFALIPLDLQKAGDLGLRALVIQQAATEEVLNDYARELGVERYSVSDRGRRLCEVFESVAAPR